MSSYVSSNHSADNAKRSLPEDLLGLCSYSSDANHGCSQEKNYILRSVAPWSRVSCLYRDFTLTEASTVFDEPVLSGIDITPALSQQMQGVRQFSFFGLVFLGLGIVPAVFLTCLRFSLEFPITNHPLLIVAIVLLLIGLQLFCFGLLAGVLLKMYYHLSLSQNPLNLPENPASARKG